MTIYILKHSNIVTRIITVKWIHESSHRLWILYCRLLGEVLGNTFLKLVLRWYTESRSLINYLFQYTLAYDQVLSLLSELKERSHEQEPTGRVNRSCKMVDIFW